MKRILIASLLVSFIAHAEDMGQTLPDMVDTSEIHSTSAGVKGSSAHVTGAYPDSPLKYETMETSPHLPQKMPIGRHLKNRELTIDEDFNSNGQTAAGTQPIMDSYSVKSQKEIVESGRYAGKNNFSMVFYSDNYNYNQNSSTGPFNRTFRDPDNSEVAIIGRLSAHKYFSRKGPDLGVGFGLGVGYNSGYGAYSTRNSEVSDARFSFWTIPLDLSLLADMPLGGFGKLGISGGPSVMGLIQHRNDVPDTDDRKDMRGAGFGMFTAAKLKIDMSGFTSNQFSMFTDYQITRSFLTLEARYQNYFAFTDDDISIDGLSFGAGFTFEYL